MAAGFCWRADCARRFAAQGFELKNDDTEHTALVEIPIPWMGAMKKGPFPLHATLKEAEARRVLITNACTRCPSLPTLDCAHTGAVSRLRAARQTEVPHTSRTTGRTTQTTVAAS